MEAPAAEVGRRERRTRERGIRAERPGLPLRAVRGFRTLMPRYAPAAGEGGGATKGHPIEPRRTTEVRGPKVRRGQESRPGEIGSAAEAQPVGIHQVPEHSQARA